MKMMKQGAEKPEDEAGPDAGPTNVRDLTLQYRRALPRLARVLGHFYDKVGQVPKYHAFQADICKRLSEGKGSDDAAIALFAILSERVLDMNERLAKAGSQNMNRSPATPESEEAFREGVDGMVAELGDHGIDMAVRLVWFFECNSASYAEDPGRFLTPVWEAVQADPCSKPLWEFAIHVTEWAASKRPDAIANIRIRRRPRRSTA